MLVAYEVNHCLNQKTKGREGHMALKLDMSKAYDRVEWFFLKKLLDRLGFNAHLINTVMICVRTVSYLVIVNGCTCGNFRPSRGIRQGNPLSPFLFLFCAEALSTLIT